MNLVTSMAAKQHQQAAARLRAQQARGSPASQVISPPRPLGPKWQQAGAHAATTPSSPAHTPPPQLARTHPTRMGASVAAVRPLPPPPPPPPTTAANAAATLRRRSLARRQQQQQRELRRPNGSGSNKSESKLKYHD